MNFRQFAFNNVKRNLRAYSAYFLSSAFAVMIFFTYAMFIFHPELEKLIPGPTTKDTMKVAEYMIFIVAFLFVLYSISAFLKARKKEFGILTIHGAKGSQINTLIILENMIIGVAAILTGMGSGALLAKGFFILAASMLEMKEQLPLYPPWEAIGLTSAAFLGLFIFISLLTPFMMRKKRVLELLLGSNQHKSEPTTSIFLSLLSIFCFICVIWFMKQDVNRLNMIIIMLLGLIGTYFFFSQLSVFLVRLLKKNRRFFWRKINLIWLSEMAYKMKDNARMFFMVTILITMACSFSGIVLAFQQQSAEKFTENPFAFTYNPSEKAGDKWKAEVGKVDQELDQVGVKFEKIMINKIYFKFKETETSIMKESDYNQLMRVHKLEKIKNLKDNEAIMVTSPDNQIDERIKEEIESQRKLKQLTLKEKNHLLTVEQKENMLFDAGMLVVSDATYQQLKQVALQADSKKQDLEISSINYFVPDWPSDRLPTASSLEVKVGSKLDKAINSENESGESIGFLQSRGSEYFGSKQATQVYMFIGIFIAAVFTVSIASFLYFKFYTDLNQDQRIYNRLSKIGLTAKEMNRSSTIQMASLFFIPLIVAGLQSLISLSMLNHSLGFNTLYTPVLTAIGAFVALQFIQFLIVRYLYLRQLKRVMV
ncbi:putative ABC transport system permease protein [Croceifilum oryzae]|uniref:ABC transport system permease protein n=1 Tax=Croceifilum oryzae TaxID=1553429 RepID=A0AAJ1WRP7_9BACL|nr:FtsX-like permease family protein [Croceifilum oryzae]MDQ0416815.1 putative ABC transport system permease protein [Croceifilum oryzae]